MTCLNPDKHPGSRSLRFDPGVPHDLAELGHLRAHLRVKFFGGRGRRIRAEKAERLAGSIDLRRLNTDYGVNAPVPSHEEVRNYPYTEADRGRMAHHRGRVVLGTPAIVRISC